MRGSGPKWIWLLPLLVLIGFGLIGCAEQAQQETAEAPESDETREAA